MLIEQGLKERVMKLSMIVGLAAGWGTALVGSAGCGGEDPTSSSALPAPVNGVYSFKFGEYAVESSEVHLGAFRYGGLRQLARGLVGLLRR